MYDFISVKRKIAREGVDGLIFDLSSGKLSDDAKKQLTDCGILSNGYPNLSLIYSLT